MDRSIQKRRDQRSDNGKISDDAEMGKKTCSESAGVGTYPDNVPETA